MFHWPAACDHPESPLLKRKDIRRQNRSKPVGFFVYVFEWQIHNLLHIGLLRRENNTNPTIISTNHKRSSTVKILQTLLDKYVIHTFRPSSCPPLRKNGGEWGTWIGLSLKSETYIRLSIIYTLLIYTMLRFRPTI